MLTAGQKKSLFRRVINLWFAQYVGKRPAKYLFNNYFSDKSNGLNLSHNAQENVEAIDNEEKNHPELRYGVYKNPAEGPSWRLEPGEYYNPA